jgi:hypothetical protein
MQHMSGAHSIEQASFDDLKELAQAERNIRTFLEEHMLDDAGLVYSHLNANTLRPWTAEEIRDGQFQFGSYNVERGDGAGQLAYEDSLMGAGEYALSLVTQYEVTGDPSPLAAASFPIFAILRVLYEGELYEPGFLPKPHGGLRKAAYSHEISVDQYIKAIIALRAFQKYCGPALAKQIDRCLVDMAHYHLVRNFNHPRRESMVITPENRSHGIAFFIPSVFLARKISGDDRYREALSRFDPILDDMLAGEVPRNCNIASLFMEGFHLAIEEGLEDERLPRLMRKLWDARIAASLERGFEYDDPAGDKKTCEAIRIASFAPIMDNYFPDAQAYKVAIALLKRWQDPRQMRYLGEMTDDLPPGREYLLESIREVSVTSWLVAYWRLMQQRSNQI